jgi:PAS domain S-box-containing protein
MEVLKESEKLDQNTLSRLYKLALGTVACLLISGQILVQFALGQQADNTYSVNAAGRQCTQSERISKLALYLKQFPEGADRQDRSEELMRVLKEFEHVQSALILGDPALNLQSVKSAAVKTMFATIDKPFQEIDRAAKEIVAAGGAVSDEQIEVILSQEQIYLNYMEQLVSLMQLESRDRVQALQRLEITLLMLALFVLFLEATYIFRPAIGEIVRAYNENLADKERIEKQIDQQVALSSLSQGALMRVALSELFGFAVRDVQDVLGVSVVTIFEIDTKNRGLVLKASAGVFKSPEIFAFTPEMETAFGPELQNLKGISSASHEFRNLWRAVPDTADVSVSVPIKSHQKPHGLLTVYAAPDHAFTEDDIDFLHSSADLIGIAIDYAKSRSELEEKTAKLESIIDTAADGIIALDEYNCIVSFNKAAQQLFLVTSEEVVGKNLSEFLLPESTSGNARSSRTRMLALHGSGTIQLRGQRSDGTVFPIEAGMSHVRLAGYTLSTCIIRDITERKEVERRVREFYSTVSHELRTPLTSIRGALGLMEGGLAGVLAPKAAQLVKVARTESDRLIRLINDILDIQKIEADKLRLKLKEVSAEELVASTVVAIAGMASESNVEIVSSVNGGGKITCDEDRICQVLTNLVANAVKYSPEGSQVVVSLDSGDPTSIKFSVTDAGPGIAPEQVHKLFGKFQQLDSSDARQRGGTGLGLAITKAIVEQHGGTIGVESRVGKGSTFWFQIPRKVQAEVLQGSKA